MPFNGQKLRGLSEKLSVNPQLFLVKCENLFFGGKYFLVKFLSKSAVGNKLV